MTKKAMLEQFPEVSAERDLLSLYLYDTQTGAVPDATEKHSDADGKLRIQLWRATGAAGGYVVIRQDPGSPHIAYLDDAIRQYAGNYSEHTLGIRVCLERLQVVRNRLMAA